MTPRQLVIGTASYGRPARLRPSGQRRREQPQPSAPALPTPTSTTASGTEKSQPSIMTDLHRPPATSSVHDGDMAGKPGGESERGTDTTQPLAGRHLHEYLASTDDVEHLLVHVYVDLDSLHEIRGQVTSVGIVRLRDGSEALLRSAVPTPDD